MINSTAKNQKKKIIVTLIVIGFIAVLIFVYRKSPPVVFFEGIVQSVFSAPKSFFYSLGKNKREDEVKILEEKVKKLEQKLVDFDLTKKDNEALRSQFASSGETTQSLTSAKIIGFLGENQKPAEFIINAGLREGVAKGMTVVFEKYLVGKVEEATSNYSVVMTPFSSRFQVLAKLDETGANGIVIGRGDLLLFDGVLITDILKKDGVITTKGEVDKNGIGVLPDMIIGKITSISKRETAPFQSAQLSPMLDYTKLTNVFVITKM